MTKTLTEQWKDDTLTDGYYYTKKITYPETYPSCDEHIIESIDLYGCDYGFDDDMDICEVLSAVPSYDEYKRLVSNSDESVQKMHILENKIKLLEEQLNYALETMGQIAKLSDNMVDSVQCAHAICLINERLKEMEGVK